ncbi:MAG: thiol-disulfide oxidoreductase DCC family protein [Beijerinckiaceae bacterium]
MSTEKASTVYYDGSCPLCRAEISHYRAQEGAEGLCFVDVSQPGARMPPGMSNEQAMKRFHVRTDGGDVLSGARAFVSVWSALPRWRWAARFASLPGVTFALELAYRAFLPVRPLIARAAGRFLGSKAR